MEMKNIFSKTKMDFINLYMNDVEMLNNSLKAIQTKDSEPAHLIELLNKKTLSLLP